MLQVETEKAGFLGAGLSLEGWVETCPRCGRFGIERRTLDGLVCIHEESLEMMSDGLLVIPVEVCSLEPLPFAISHPELI